MSSKVLGMGGSTVCIIEPTARDGGMGFIAKATRHLFFTGKGGVGKTSLSTAAALMLADAGRKVLLVSTDAASNLDEMLDLKSMQPNRFSVLMK